VPRRLRALTLGLCLLASPAPAQLVEWACEAPPGAGRLPPDGALLQELQRDGAAASLSDSEEQVLRIAGEGRGFAFAAGRLAGVLRIPRGAGPPLLRAVLGHFHARRLSEGASWDPALLPPTEAAFVEAARRSPGSRTVLEWMADFYATWERHGQLHACLLFPGSLRDALASQPDRARVAMELSGGLWKDTSRALLLAALEARPRSVSVLAQLGHEVSGYDDLEDAPFRAAVYGWALEGRRGSRSPSTRRSRSSSCAGR
jgi:hypothetical protein